MKLVSLCIQAAFLTVLIFSCKSFLPKRAQAQSDKFQKFENSISPFVVFTDQKQKFSIAERMRHYRVPGLTLAIIANGQIVFAKSYGVKEITSESPITNDTIFQVASVSKPITAIGALTLVDTGQLDLDTDVNRYLKSWSLPDSTFTKESKVTLRRILSHTAGLTVGGFLGYQRCEKIPTAVEILSGHGNSAPVIVDTIPGSITRYSGGGTVIEQLIIEDVSAVPFADFMSRNVLAPLEMKNSRYDQPLPKELESSAAAGHRPDGAMVTGRYRVHPELGPAGLWSTAEDLSKAMIEIQKTYLGLSSKLPLSHSTVKQMLTAQGERFGLGPKIKTKDDIFIFEHAGSNIGYKAQWVGFIDQTPRGIQQTGGIVALSNGDSGFHLIEEIMSAIGETMGWNFLIEDRQEMPFKPLTEREQEMAGVFDKDGEDIFITENDGVLNFWGHEIYKVDDFTFVSGTGHRNIFKLSEDKNTLEVDVTFKNEREFLVLKRK